MPKNFIISCVVPCFVSANSLIAQNVTELNESLETYVEICGSVLNDVRKELSELTALYPGSVVIGTEDGTILNWAWLTENYERGAALEVHLGAATTSLSCEVNFTYEIEDFASFIAEVIALLDADEQVSFSGGEQKFLEGDIGGQDEDDFEIEGIGLLLNGVIQGNEVNTILEINEEGLLIYHHLSWTN